MCRKIGHLVMGDISPLLGGEATGTSSLDASFELDFIDELLGEKDQLEIPGCSTFLNPDVLSPALSPFDPCKVSALPEKTDSSFVPEVLEKEDQGGEERLNFSLDPSIQLQTGKEGILGDDARDQDNNLIELAVHNHGSGISSPKNSVMAPVVNDDLVPSIKERLTYVLMYVKESHRESGVLVQIWVPVKKGGQYVLTTCGQPFWLDHHFQRLVNYRMVSTNYQFSAVKNSKEALGLPGRVFVGKVPEWTPDVRFFSSDEYPRVNHAQQYDVRGSVAVPIFEREKHSCLGVLEIVMINEKVNYDADLENICNALQAVNLRSSVVTSLREIQVRNDSYHTALPEISEVLRVVCHKHKLPLAQTWIPCIQQGKRGTRHSDENYQHCVSTVDTACCVHDASVWGFHKACSEHHLFIGQGLVGHAFTTNQPCFSSDVTALNRTRYPLSHHARIFDLHGAVAIRLRSIQTGTTDFVLEFFLPVDCIGFAMQKLLLNSLSATIQEVSRTLRVVTELELAQERTFLVGNMISLEELQENEVLGDGQKPTCHGVTMPGAVQIPAYHCQELLSVTPDVIEAQTKEKAWSLPSKQLSFEEGDTPNSGVALQWGDAEMLSVEDLFSDFMNTQVELAHTVNFNVASLSHEPGPNKEKKMSKKKRGKVEKIISSQVLHQHFSDSLKDAAKSLGVCPTTLKRICRVKGITRWPSRKIKKVGNSLQKLQKVIDSVQGVEGSSELNLLYSKLSDVSNSDLIAQTAKENNALLTLIPSDELKPAEGDDGLENIYYAKSNSSHSSGHGCSLSPSSCSCSKQLEPTNIEIKDNSGAVEGGIMDMKRTPIETGLHQLAGDPEFFEVKSKAKNLLVPQSDHTDNFLRVKVACGDDVVRLKLQPTWGLQDLKLEIAKRFNIENMNSVNLKYLDDDSEWVLLMCDADLHECIDVHMRSSSPTIKISVHFPEERSMKCQGRS